jgi:hypothetical protein
MFSNPKEKDQYVQGVWEKLDSTYLGVYFFLTDEEFEDLYSRRAKPEERGVRVSTSQ